MRSTPHDYPIYEISAVAESLGYNIEGTHLGTEQGPDLVIRNLVNQLGVFKVPAPVHAFFA